MTSEMAKTSEEMLSRPSSWCDSEELKSLGPNCRGIELMEVGHSLLNPTEGVHRLPRTDWVYGCV